MQPLDPLTLPLHGTRLIEASAGTGKTYTLSLLFLRLLLERGLAVDQILVVTFTRAATSELRDRIRARLRQALAYLDHQQVAEPVLVALLHSLPPEQCRVRLADALVRIDETAIHTIHGFCQRALQEHAFEAGSLFEFELLETEETLRMQVMEDFWRNRFYGADSDEAGWAASLWQDPAGLLRALGRTVTLHCDLTPVVDQQKINDLIPRVEVLFAEVRRSWQLHAETVQNILETHPDLQRNEKTYRLSDRVPELLAAINGLAAMANPPRRLPPGIEKLGNTAMTKALKTRCQTMITHEFFTVFDRFYQAHAQLQELQTLAILHEARNFLQSALTRRKQLRRWLGYDDLLTQFVKALEQPQSGRQLATRMCSRYPAALIDEFQDTDPVQYRIFSHIYRRDRTCCLFLIGDPKQAIYAFRGADIFTYMQARRETPQNNRITMTTNYRATAPMVQAVNTLFGNRQDSFVFTDDIIFHPVEAAPEQIAQPLIHSGLTVPPLTALLLDSERLKKGKASTISKEQAARAAATYSADLLLELLEAGQEGQTTINNQPLRAGDIAILVRSHRQADVMREALQQRGLKCAALNQQSVFAGPEAKNLLEVLTAIEDPSDPGRLRYALTTDLFGLTGEELYQLTTDEHAWEHRLTTFFHCRRIWREQGIFSMFQYLLTTEGITRRLTAQHGGSRSLTNYLHLVELLQQSHTGRHGTTALLRWFHRQIDIPDTTAENQLIRLESDEEVVRIVTIHGSKGLEFPVVMLPFLWAERPSTKTGPIIFHDRNTLRLTADLGSGVEKHDLWAEEEALAEELRLLYVAITRAKSACLFCWGRVKGMEHTALSYLLHNGLCPADDTELTYSLEQLNRNETLLALRPYPATFSSHRAVAKVKKVQLQPAIFHGQINPGWTMTSYSRLSGGKETDPIGESGGRDDVPFQAAEDFTSIFTFPRGPVAGTCLHTLLEQLEYTRPAGEQLAMIDQALLQAGINRNWQTAVAGWLDDLLTVPLPGTCSLGQLPEQDRLHELDFLFPLHQVDLHRFNTLLIQGGGRSLNISSTSLHGLMKGFIDLVFRHEGRYYIVDYKSNYLGPDYTAYDPQSLVASMENHQYHLQALIYTLALHRYLNVRIKGYAYDQHFGGVYYLFLRAMHPALPQGTGIHFSRADHQLVAALDACCHGEQR